MHPLFKHIKRKTETKFHGIIGIPFQYGKIGNIKESNVLPSGFHFVGTTQEKVFTRITKWQESNFFGTMEIPIQNGIVGKPKECRVLKVEEL